MTLLAIDDAAFLAEGEPQRYVLGDLGAPLLVLNALDDEGVMWVCEEPQGWDAPSVDLPIDRRQDGHGGIPGEPTYEERVLSFAGSAEAPDLRTALRARQRLLAAWSQAVRTGEELLYTHADEDPPRSLYVLPTGKPRVEVVEGRWLDYAFVLVAGDPIKRGAEATYGPALLPAAGTEPGRRYSATGRSYPRVYAGGGAGVVLAENLARNGAPVTTNGWTGNAGTGGVSTLSIGSDGTAPVASGTYFRRTWTTGSTAVGGGNAVGAINANVSPYTIPVAAGQSYGVAMHVRSSKRQRLALQLLYYDAAGAQLATTTLPAVVVDGLQWVRFAGTGIAPANAVRVVPQVAAVVGAEGVVWAAGDYLDTTGAIVVAGAADPGAYFDGNTPDTTGVDYAWTGTPFQSSSTRTSILPSTYAGTPVDNPGDEYADALYRITGPLPRPIVQLATGEYLRLDLDLASNLDEAVVDTESGTVYVNGTNRSDAIAPGSSFPLIPPGGVEVRLRSGTGASNTTARLYVTTSPRWT